MLMSEWIRQRLVEPAKERRLVEVEKRRAEGRAELIAEIKDWELRRQTAEERGEHFDELPPYLQNGTSDNAR